MKNLVLAAVAFGLMGCVVEPAPVAPGPPVAATPYYYGCCYSYPEYPPYYGYYGPSIAFGYYGGGHGGWHGGGWHH